MDRKVRRGESLQKIGEEYSSDRLSKASFEKLAEAVVAKLNRTGIEHAFTGAQTAQISERSQPYCE